MHENNPDSPGFTLLYTGRGRPARDMATIFTDSDPAARDQWEIGAEVVGRDLMNLTLDHDQSVIEMVEVQSVGHAVAMAIATDYAFRCGMPTPVAVGGMSMGEMLTAYATGSMDFETLMRVSAERGRIMAREAARLPEGGCGLLVNVSEEAARDLVATVSDLGMIDVACALGKGAFLIAGFEPALSEAAALAGGMGWRWIPQAAEAPWHTSAVDRAADELRDFLRTQTIKDPKNIFVSPSREHPVTTADEVIEVIGLSSNTFLDVPRLTNRLHAFAPDRMMVRLTARGSLQPPRLLEPFEVPLNTPRDVENVLSVIRMPAPAA